MNNSKVAQKKLQERSAVLYARELERWNRRLRSPEFEPKQRAVS